MEKTVRNTGANTKKPGAALCKYFRSLNENHDRKFTYTKKRQSSQENCELPVCVLESPHFSPSKNKTK